MGVNAPNLRLRACVVRMAFGKFREHYGECQLITVMQPNRR